MAYTKIKVGMQIHDIFNRKWMRVLKVEGETVELVGYGCWRKMTRAEFIQLANSSPLNKKWK